MNLSIRKKILLLVANALILLIAFAGIVSWQFSRINANKETIALTSEALRDQMQADMMHDALRADVLAALHAAATKDQGAAADVAKDLAEHAGQFRDSVKANHERTLDDSITAALASVDKPLQEYIRSAESIIALAAKDRAAAEEQLPAFSETFSQLEVAMGKVGDTVEASVRTVSTASGALVTQFRITVVTTLLLAVVSLSLLSWFIARGIVTGLDRIGQQLDLGAHQLTESSREVSHSSQTLAESASEQAASLEETSASLEEISAMTKRNGESASNGKSLGREARESASSGMERLGELTRTLNSIKSATGEMQTAVQEMQTSSQEIAKIIKTIDEIAFQTNLLALNAAVEAARAGEAGMGFAVVADEVRALAQRSAQAAKDTSEKIESAVKRSELGGAASAKVVRSLTEVEATAQTIQQVFTGIVGQIKSLDEVISQIAAASQEQTQGIREVNMAVSQMDKVTQSNAASAEENASAATVLNAQAATVLQSIRDLHTIVTGDAAEETADFSPPPPKTVAVQRSVRPAKFAPAARREISLEQFQNF